LLGSRSKHDPQIPGFIGTPYGNSPIGKARKNASVRLTFRVVGPYADDRERRIHRGKKRIRARARRAMIAYHKDIGNRFNRPPKDRRLNGAVSAAHEKHSRRATGNPDNQRTFVRAPANNVPGGTQDLPLHTTLEKTAVALFKPPDSNIPFRRFNEQFPVQTRGAQKRRAPQFRNGNIFQNVEGPTDVIRVAMRQY
jgi:hypothetical protein